MSNILFLSSTPLHSLWSLGIAAGAFADQHCALVLIDQRASDRDFIAEVIAGGMQGPFAETGRFEQVGKKAKQKLANARPRMREVMDYTRRFAPDYVAVGNDCRAEFHAALSVAPQATAAYVDDGAATYSTLADPSVPKSAFGRAVADRFRSMIYGVPSERVAYLGTSRAVDEAWAVLPEQVHDGLRKKPLRAMQPQWFHLPVVQEICAEANLRAGLDPRALEGIQLLLALPHDSFMRAHPLVRDRLQQMLDRTLAEGGTVAIKRHPRSVDMALDLPARGVFEVPQRLPLEILAPLLSGTEVVGMLTSALIYLQWLGTDVRVATLVLPGFEDDPILRIYRSLGIRTLS